MRCIECGAKLEKTNEQISLEFRGERITVRGIEHYRCPECGEMIFDSNMSAAYNQAVDYEYRKRCGLLSPEEIKTFRTTLGLTQEQFQTLLGVGKLSVCRWETGRLAQSKTVDNLIRAYMSCPRLVTEALERAELSNCFNTKKASISAGSEELCAYAQAFMLDKSAGCDNRYIKTESVLIEGSNELQDSSYVDYLRGKTDVLQPSQKVAA